MQPEKIVWVTRQQRAMEVPVVCNYHDQHTELAVCYLSHLQTLANEKYESIQ